MPLLERTINRDTLLADPAVKRAILAAGFTSHIALRWLRIPIRYNIRTLGEYLDIPDEDLLHRTNFGVKCLEVTRMFRQRCDNNTEV